MREAACLAVSATLVCLGCSGETVRFIETPPVDDARSWVFAFHDPTDSLRVYALDRDDTRALELDETVDGVASIEVLAYREGLESLGLPRGLLSRDETVAGRRLPKRAELFTRDLDVGSWVAETSPSEALGEFRYHPPSPCLPMTVETQPLAPLLEGDSGDARVLAALPMGEDAALISLQSVRAGLDLLVRATPDGLELISGCGGGYRAGHAVDDSHFWMTQMEGSPRLSLLEVDAEAGTCTTSTVVRVPEPLTSGSRLAFLTGPTGDVDGPLFVMSSTGTIYRYELGRFDVITRVELSVRDQRPSGFGDGDLVWIGPGRIAAVVGSLDVTWWTAPDIVRREPFELTFDVSELQELSAFPDGSLYVAAITGEVFRSDGVPGSWELIEQFTHLQSSILSYNGGWLRVDGRTIGQYYEGFGACPSTFEAVGGADGSPLIGWSSGLVLAPDLIRGKSEALPELVWLTPR